MRLLLDVMCGGLVAYLRMCNHDTVYAGDRGLEADDVLLALAREEGRTLVTRDVELATRAAESPGSILLEEHNVEAQLAELASAGVSLELPAEPRLCGRCNGSLEAVESDAPTPAYAPTPEEFSVWRCQDCGHHFWRGSHWDRVEQTLAQVSSGIAESNDEG
ncbi:DUF5615 family PIN-like protein [Natronolimnobius sp. AArcel1]|uniref:Mut7-C RNAse domain-containing protein n=1 Tax=Natronolimnobius sp. AArcel1 TaxID=1679093 RepID=UPI0013EAD264|nr:Mut7-C RNAse domain-containing protein [Natronolimnobius sp. AArcel1]NGM69582.1 DUF5615 family PIN-like protein [Natronolimnobius sp. AArcel1]